MRLEGHVAIVTGLSHAGQVGYALAAAFAREGAHLAISARSAKRVHARAEELRGAGAKVIAVPADLTTEEGANTLVQEKLAHRDIKPENMLLGRSDEILLSDFGIAIMTQSSGQQLRASLGKSAPPLNVIVTAHGEVNLKLPVFQSGEVPVLLVTTTQGAERIRAQRLPSGVELQAIQSAGSLSARTILQAVNRVRKCEVILVEGGPQLLGDFFAERMLDELFLTLAPQIAGRDAEVERPGLVSGKRFAPAHPLWGTLISVKRGGSHLFLRYAFQTREDV